MTCENFTRLLVTGGAGFIGCNFVQTFFKQYPSAQIVVLDALTYAGSLENLDSVQHHAGFTFVQGDINDLDLVQSLLREHNLQAIVHFAAESHVDRSISGPDVFVQTNIVGTHTLLKAARQVWMIEALEKTGSVMPHRFHHVSTDEVYGSLSMTDPAFLETTAYAPNSPYSASKAASDHLVRAYYKTYGMDVTTSNCSNNFGLYQHTEKLIPTVVRHLLNGQLIPIYGNGQNIRDWLFVEDHCYGIAKILAEGEKGETYNIGSDNELTNLELTHQICDIIDQLFESSALLKQQYPKCPATSNKACVDSISFVTDRAGHDFRYAINSEKFTARFGDLTTQPFVESLTKTIQFYL